MSGKYKIVYHFNQLSHSSIVDNDTYGYINMVYDIYNSVLRHVPVNRSLSFMVKCILPGGVNDIDLSTDHEVMTMFDHFEEGNVINLHVFNVDMADRDDSDFRINGFPSSIIGRGDVFQLMAPESDFVEVPFMTEGPSRPPKKHVRRGGTTIKSCSRSEATTTSISPRNVRTRRNETTAGPSIDPTTRVRSSSKTVVCSDRNSDCIRVQSKGDASSGNEVTSNNSSGLHASTHSDANVGTPEVTSKVINAPAVSEASLGGSRPSSSRDKDKGKSVIEDEIQTVDSGDDNEWKDGSDGSIDNSSSDEDYIQDEKEEEVDDEEEGEEDPEVIEGANNSEDELSGYDSEEYHAGFATVENANPEEGQLKLEEGQVFGDIHKLRRFMRDYYIQHGFTKHLVKNEPKRYTAMCKGKGCPWRVHLSNIEDEVTLMVKTLNPVHTCTRLAPKNPNTTSPWIADKLAIQLRADPKMKSEAMGEYIKQKYGISCTPMQLYRARKYAKQQNEGSHVQQYADLPRYGVLLMEKNPGSVFKLEYESQAIPLAPPQFKRVFICLDACRKGFIRGCRPFLGIDGCHLKGIYQGVILAAVALDGNNGLFPLAFGVVEVECKQSWEFFLHNLYACLFIDMDEMQLPLTFMSDKQKGLSEAISEIFPNANHRHCSRHLYNNFKVKFPGANMRSLFWQASKAYSQFAFEKAMEAMKCLNNDAHEWLLKNPVCMWSRHAYDHRVKSEHITNNMTESFNQWIAEDRDKPILTLIDQIRVKLMSRLHSRYQKACSSKDKVTPDARKKLEKIKQESRFCRSIPCGQDRFEVIDGMQRFVVSLQERTCICKVWEAIGLPCKHGAAGILYNRASIEDFCDPYFSLKKYMMAHQEMINPMPDISMVPIPSDAIPLHPPKLRRLPGRPHKNRRREEGEGRAGEFRKRSSSVKCDICKQIGHNRRTCQGAPVKDKGKSARPRVGVKRKRATSSQSEVFNSQVHTRSQTTHDSSNEAVKERKLAAMAKKRAYVNARRAAAREKGT